MSCLEVQRRYVWWMVAAVTLLAAGGRVGWVVVRYGDDPQHSELSFPDEEAYWRSARSLANGDGLVDEFGYRATYMPAYPAFLALFAGTSRPFLYAGLIQAILGAGVAPATWLLARQWLAIRAGEANERIATHDRTCEVFAALLAGLASAFDPFLVFFSGLFLTETLFAVLHVVGWTLVLRLCHRERLPQGYHALVAGAVFLGMLLLRPSSVVLVAVVPLLLLVMHGMRPPAWGHVVLFTGVIVIGLLPWAVRNRQVTCEWIWLTTRGGISLYDGLRPGSGGESDLAHTKDHPQVQDMSETEWAAYWKTKALRFAADQPGEVARLAGRKFLRTWSLVPNVPEHRHGRAATVSLVWMSLTLLLAAVGAWRVYRPMRFFMVLLLPVVVITMLHMVFVGSVRYRVPLMPMLYVLSGYGLAWLISLRRTRTDSASPLTDGS